MEQFRFSGRSKFGKFISLLFALLMKQMLSSRYIVVSFIEISAYVLTSNTMIRSASQHDFAVKYPILEDNPLQKSISRVFSSWRIDVRTISPVFWIGFFIWDEHWFSKASVALIFFVASLSFSLKKSPGNFQNFQNLNVFNKYTVRFAG